MKFSLGFVLLLAVATGTQAQLYTPSTGVIPGGNGYMGLNTGGTAPQINFEIVGWGQIIRNPTNTSYATSRLYNNYNDVFHSLSLDYGGSSYPGSILTGGPVGEAGALSTVGAFPLMLGTSNTVRMLITSAGNVGIGTTNPGSFKLAVEGKIGAREINVTTTNPFPDYVFESSYNLPSLEEVERYIKKNNHLPDVPTAKEVEKDGVDLGEMNILLLKKIEELTLYVIELKKVTDVQSREIADLKVKGNK